MKSNNDSISSSTLSAAPSITASKTSTNNINNNSFKQSKFSLNSGYSHSLHSVNSFVGSIRSHGSSSQDTQASSANLDKDKELDKVEDLVEKAKFYTSLCLGTTAILSVFAFLFLIPFVVDPAISTIVADYDPVPVTCITTDHVYAMSLSNCSWASCREGCTTTPVRCHQILVNYSRIPFHEWEKITPRKELDSVEWDVMDTRLLINTEGCGYPPRVNCTIFAKEYGASRIGDPFPCYYSRAYPEQVVVRYSWDDNLKHLILSLIIPNVLFAVSIGVLSYWYCPCCDKACHKNPRVNHCDMDGGRAKSTVHSNTSEISKEDCMSIISFDLNTENIYNIIKPENIPHDTLYKRRMSQP
uniref:CSON006832 protein n=1 Tax=Culicoides sonorensis TaxID=179676 RepID=A0A336M0C4_CULSO